MYIGLLSCTNGCEASSIGADSLEGNNRRERSEELQAQDDVSSISTQLFSFCCFYGVRHINRVQWKRGPNIYLFIAIFTASAEQEYVMYSSVREMDSVWAAFLFCQRISYGFSQ